MGKVKGYTSPRMHRPWVPTQLFKKETGAPFHMFIPDPVAKGAGPASFLFGTHLRLAPARSHSCLTGKEWKRVYQVSEPSFRVWQQHLDSCGPGLGCSARL